jgi:chorismate mutase
MNRAKEAAMSDLTQFRADIDDIDDRIIDLLARRFAICRQVADYKLRHGIPVVLPERIEQVKTRCADRAGRQGVNPAFVLALYTLIIEETCETERALQGL